LQISGFRSRARALWVRKLPLFGEPRTRRRFSKQYYAVSEKSLLDAGCAIGGEIKFDPTPLSPFWLISNKSRRYGTHPSRSASHLNNVASQFADFLIPLIPKFM
jgi:hypothetical protein